MLADNSTAEEKCPCVDRANLASRRTAPKLTSPKEHKGAFLWGGLFKGNILCFKHNFLNLFFSSD